jgi:C4-dicarboxylate transporter
MESIATTKKDLPTTEIKLVSAHIFVDSIADKREELISAEKEKKEAVKEKEKSKVHVLVQV